MPELRFESFVTVHGEDQLTGWADDAPGTLKESTTKSLNLAEAPQRGAFRRGATGARVESDLEFASKVVSKNAGEHVQLISHPRLDRYVVHLAMRFELGEDALLRATSIVEDNDLAWIDFLVGYDDLELVAILDGLKQIELNGWFILAPDLFLDEDEATASIPRLRLPTGLEIA